MCRMCRVLIGNGRSQSSLPLTIEINLVIVLIINYILRYGNQRQAGGSKINLFYSTPSCYLKSLYDANTTWPTKRDDFFPYASDPHSFWTGYFTSRPTLKRFERVGNHFLQVNMILLKTYISNQLQLISFHFQDMQAIICDRTEEAICF